MAELSLLAKATIVLALALMAARALRGARASVRALLLSSAFGAVLVLPAATWLMPERSVAVPIAYAENVALVLEQVDDSAPAVPVTGPRAEAIGPAWRLPPVATMLRALWVLVTIGLLFRLGMALWHLRSIRRTGVPWLDGADVVNDLAARAGLRRHVDVFVHEELSAPMTFGTLRPAIGLPTDAPRWDHAALHHALVHELEHVRRGDWPVYVAAKVACAVYWFHPLAWIAARQLCLEAERAADDAVLRDAEGTAYAEQLVSLARRVSRSSPVAVLSMAARSDLSTRVRAVLNPHQVRGRPGVVCTAATVAVAFVLTLIVSPLRAVATAPAADPSASAPAQVDGAGLKFELASIRRNVSAEQRPPGLVFNAAPNGQLTAQNMTLFHIIRNAYDMQGVQIAAGANAPDWFERDRWDIVAKAPEGMASRLQMMAMMQNLLATRFKLVVRRETRELPVYALVLARSDRQLGPRLRQSDGQCEAARLAAEKGVALRQTPEVERGFCGSRSVAGLAAMSGVALADLARYLSPQTGRLVIDRTGLTGTFDLDLTWTPDLTAPAGGRQSAFNDGTSLFAALQEQLGLKLEPQRSPAEVLVIESAERPVED